MPRVPILSREDLAEANRDIYDDYESVRGVGPSVIHRAIANSPDILRAYMPISNALRFGTKLDARLRELAIVMVGHVTASAYEVEAHTRFALKAGVSEAQLNQLSAFETSSVYGDQERAVLRYAEEVTRENRISSATWAALEAQFDREEITEIVLQVGFYNTVVRILGAFDIQPEPSA